MLSLPKNFKQKLEEDTQLNGIVLKTLSDFSEIFEENRLYFFEEYTNHGIKHIQKVLNAADEIIYESNFHTLITSKDVSAIVLAVILHDLGMHTPFATFKKMVGGEIDGHFIIDIDEKKWPELWDEFLDEAKKFSSKRRKQIFGNEFQEFHRPTLDNQDNLTGADRKLIGEFLRRHHPRIAHEIANAGFIGHNDEVISFACDLPKEMKDIVGLIARSHEIEIRNTFDYLKKFSEEEWAQPYSVHVVFLMVVLRVADYFQFDASRVSEITLKLKTFSSPISKQEHNKHLAIKFVKPSSKDDELLMAEANPVNSLEYLQLKSLFKDIQYELDVSWAILGEIYGKEPIDKRPAIKYRRIKSNLTANSSFTKNVNYIPEKITLDADVELPKLLIAPLYGNHPTYGVRELLQNAVDACKEREEDELRKNNKIFAGKVIFTIQKNNADRDYIEIKDNGKGMSLFEIKNYFLKAGASFRKSLDWQKKYVNEKGETLIQRNGRFGVGVLAAYLLGDEIEVITKSIYSDVGYTFSAKLDSEQIEVTKLLMNDFGTSIKIYLNDHVKSKLLIPKDDDHEKLIHFTQWYTLKSPTIQFNIFDKEQIGYIDLDPNVNEQLPNEWHAIQPHGIAKVNWTYSKKFTNQKLTINGIVIPGGYRFMEGLIVNEPFLSVFDYDGNLDLSLSRNSLSEKYLPFEEMLKLDIYKDIIAKLLLFEPRTILTKDIFQPVREKFVHDALSGYYYYGHNDRFFELIFHEKGFFINHDFFISKLKSLEIVDINFAYESGARLEGDFSDLFLKADFTEKSNITDLSFALDPSNFHGSRGRITAGSEQYKKMFIDKLRVRKNLKRDHEVESSTKDWTVFTLGYFKSIIFDVSNYVGTDAINLVSEYTVSNFYPKSNKGFNELLELYFQTQVFIPYSMDERKELFSKAFNELEVYMRKYKK